MLHWLKHMNARGNDIYVRPAQDAAPHGLVLVDDLTADTIVAMKRAGHHPALVLETSPNNFQAWVKIPPRAPDALRTAVARLLAKTYHADLNSAHSRHYGRLAGFTNRKPAYRTETGYPWVLLRESKGHVLPPTAELLRTAVDTVAANVSKPSSFRRRTTPTATDLPDPTDYVRTDLARLHKRYGNAIDWSRADWMISRQLVRLGYTSDQVKQALLAGAYELDDRKNGHVDDYVARTARNAIDRFGNAADQKDRSTGGSKGLTAVGTGRQRPGTARRGT
jgi:hypothetical protein